MSLLTVRVAAERMGIGYSTLKQWIRQGKIRTTQTAGGHHRLSESEVDRMLARQDPTAKAPPRRADRPTGLIVALSGRNRLRGFVEEVRIDGLLGQVRLRIGDQILTPSSPVTRWTSWATQTTSITSCCGTWSGTW